MEKVYLVVIDECFEGEHTVINRVFSTLEKAKKYFNKDVEEELAELGDDAVEECSPEDTGDAKYLYSKSDISFKFWEDDYAENDSHTIWIEEKEVE